MAREPATHDAFFKQLMSEPATVERFLAEHLSPGLAAAVVPGSMVRLDSAFVDPRLRRSVADLLFGLQVRTGHGGEREAFAVLLLEHKSAPDPLTRLQVLRYELGIWQRWLDDGRGLPLPPVIAVVVHHGPQGWRASPQFQDLFGDLPEALIEAVPRFRHELVDLVAIPDDRLSGEAALRVKLSLMKYMLAADLDARLDRLLAEAVALGIVELRKVMAYIETNTARVSQTRLRAALNAAVAIRGEDAMGILELLEEEGLLKGLARGKAEGKAETLVRLLERRFGPLGVDDRARIGGAEIAQLDTWFDRLFDAQHLRQVLGD